MTHRIGSLAGSLARRVRRAWAPALLLTVLAPHAQAALPRVHAITHARVVVAPGQVLGDANIIIRDGLIVAVGKDAAVPADARVWPGDSLTVYAGLIDAFVMPPAAAPPAAALGRRPGSQPPPPEPARGAANPQPTVRAEVRVVEGAPIDAAQLASLRAAGFTAVQFAPREGIVRGSSAVLNLGDGPVGANVLKSDHAQVIALDPASVGYPGSLMGAISVIRQAFIDAKWYRDANAAYARKPAAAQRVATDNALAALQSVIANQQPALFVADEMLESMRAVAIAREAGVTAQVVGGGDEYKRVASIAALGVPMVIPVNFPDAPDVADDEKAIEVSTEELRQWQDAPRNPAALAKAGVTFALTANGLKDTKTFADNVGKAIARGLSADAALAAVTTVPAKLLGLDAKLGTIAPGHIANLTIVRGTLFAGGKLREVWIDGERYETAKDDASPKGEWRLGSGASIGMLTIAVDKDTTVSMVANGDTMKAVGVRLDDRRIRFTIAHGGRTAAYDLLARNDALRGVVVAEGHSDSVSAMPATKVDAADKAHGAKKDELVPSPVVMGNTEPWRLPLPAQPAAVLIKHATVWTAGPKGTLETSDVLVQGGKIAAVGKSLSAPKDAVVIDATGKHVAPGIIDEHSHSAILGNVNECTNSVTCEVRIQDVINSESPNLYRQLAGGATIMHLLHGSCNSIGGQCAVIKNKWGATADQLLFADAPPTVKFALGENPKQANFGADRTDRYPKTRAGVEQTIRDAFERAQDYDRAWAEYKAGTRVIPPRRDLQLDALSEIIHGKRFIHCHSYRQDEILMLMRLTEQFGFRVNTFTHILEGYKVADQMAEHGASGMGFSDWWGYKQEVIDAIPYNGYLMWDRGVNVGFNSDSDELARRLSGEAAKAIRYGGMPADEAIKTVTINPAKSLKIDQRVGSLEVGKDADFAIWSGSPLSPYSICEQTWIEGRKYFDRSEDMAGRAALAKERAALIAKVRAAKSGGSDKTGNRGNFPPRYLEDTDMSGTACGDQDHADLPFMGENARKALVRGEGGSR